MCDSESDPAGEDHIPGNRDLDGNRTGQQRGTEEAGREYSFTANGEYFGPVARYDSAGRDLAPFRFCGVVPAASAFVATRAPLSFDSRYFGPVPLSSLTMVVPLWTY